ncbi:E3 ubiquitin-protein ligase RNF14-like [Corticium candelabrum]|uniref:E3 ubiquitin-protein ligase RNF14-like n=1 Tax=Corticium candelabrum TaxID=121492 RepID=UPI002E252FBA|nr:E3 ubiquitin-protein ligase RNF14-like [Corticium candelabrum]
MADAEAVEDELKALASIYDECTFSGGEGDAGGRLSISLSIESPLQVEAAADLLMKKDNLSTFTSRMFYHLPPLMLHFHLPDKYPSLQPPQYSLSCKWLSKRQLSVLCNILDTMYQPGEVVIFDWMQFLTNEAAEVLDIRSPFQLGAVDMSNDESSHPSAVQDVASSSHLWPLLIEFDVSERKRVFDSSQQMCQVCLESKPGSNCVRLSPCDHVFCRQCMKEYFEIQISDGSVSSLRCPDPSCDSHAHPELVRELVKPELFVRYDKLLLQRGLEGMEDIVYCPRQVCQCAVLKDNDTSMAVCTRCQLAFCVLCKRAWHGVAACEFKLEELKQLRDEYERGSKAKQAFLEKKYGKKAIKTAVEELGSQEWIEENAKKCPSCRSAIQKIDGCNKMTCNKCHCYFCWLCMAVLSRNNPYGHFNSPGSKCYNLLFQGIDLDDDDDILFR